ncbi:GNAT family N-acetyltransferase [Streptomyces tateyamensis]|uniref:GNAT family N-acetyltransferase n=2 Tax=Streptomyces tateyamensis TaxID=565073 RepID=A0A2V4NH58_9ACTN|nr:GNAT family N-acetyltransferase [Streptomyces tateyamensis]
MLAVHRADGYPAQWPTRPSHFLRPADQLAAWVAVSGAGEVLGHVALGRDSSAGEQWTGLHGGDGTVAVSRLFVDPAARGQGLGERLLAAAVRQVRHWGLVPVLDVVAGSTPALHLYRSLGWQELAVVTQEWSGGVTVPVHCFALNSPADDGR